MILVGDWAPGTLKVNMTVPQPTVLANCEGPILPVDHSVRSAPKAGPSIFSTHCPVQDGSFVFSLANNHIMDYGSSGLDATLESLNQRRFRACGAGKGITEARRPLILEENGVRLGILACCEAQFGVARWAQAGTAEFGPWIYHAIDRLRQVVDVVIVSSHAAIEDSPWPSPYIQELYHSFIDAGATVVHGHHAHVPQGYETYRHGVVFYGMGNFAVNPDKWRNKPNGMWSLGAEIDFSSAPVRWRLLTFEIRREAGSNSIRIEESTKAEEASHWIHLDTCNRPLTDPGLLAGLWQEVALRAYYQYGAPYLRFSGPRGNGLYIQARKGISTLKNALLNRMRPSLGPSQHDFMLWYHLFACESHRQMLVTALGVLGGEIEDVRTEESRRLADRMLPW